MAAADVELLPTRELTPGQRTEVWVVEAVGGEPVLVFASDDLLLEAPNWAPDGTALLLNAHGWLWRLTLEPEPALQRVVIDDLPPINNDHVVDGPRGRIYLSANDGHLYAAPAPRRSGDPHQSRQLALPLPPRRQPGWQHPRFRRSTAR